MPLGRAIGLLVAFALAVITGFWVGYVSGYVTGLPEPGPVAGIDNPRATTGYHMTPHMMLYYRNAMQASHTPMPDDYQRGAAGVDYCLNLARWYVTIQGEIYRGVERSVTKSWAIPRLRYEVEHGWLTEVHSTQLSEFVDKAPEKGDKLVLIGVAIQNFCMAERSERSERPKGDLQI